MDDSRNRYEKHAIPDTWPVTQSVLLAFCLEVLPVEWETLSILCSESFFLASIVKVMCLALIFLPLLIFCVRNGLNALNHVWGRVAVVAAIVAINLALNYVAINVGR